MPGDRPIDERVSAAAPASTPAAPGGDGTSDLGYRVDLDSFSGPLDLLLYLVRRTELDIMDVQLSQIVDPFIAAIADWQEADLDVAGDFILMAATLLELKARTIAPPPEAAESADTDEDFFDPHASLIRSLLAYRRFKEAAQELSRLEAEQAPRLARQLRELIPEDPDEEIGLDLGAVDVDVLLRTFEQIMARIAGLGPRTVKVDDVPLGLRIEQLIDALRQRPLATMRELLGPHATRLVQVTTVMATLESARQRLLEVRQPRQFGDITLRLREAEELAAPPELPPPEPEGPRRRRRPPLVTFSAPVTADGEHDELAEGPEEPAETDEQRFLRELEELTRVDAVLATTADIEASFARIWAIAHPQPEVVAAKVVEPVAPPPAAAQATLTRPTTPPRVKNPVPVKVVADAESPAPVPTAPQSVAETDAPREVVVAAMEATTPVVAESPAEMVVAAGATPIDETAAVVGAAQGSDTPVARDAASIADVPEAVPPAVVDVAPAEPPAAATAAITAAAQPEATEDALAPTVAPTAPEPATLAAVVDGPHTQIAAVDQREPPRVIELIALAAPVPVAAVPSAMHATATTDQPGDAGGQPADLDDDSLGDDPAVVNAALLAAARPPARQVEPTPAAVDEEEEEDEVIDDDPAVVNAALLAGAVMADEEADEALGEPASPEQPPEQVVLPQPASIGEQVAAADDGDEAGPSATGAPNGSPLASSMLVERAEAKPLASEERPEAMAPAPAALPEPAEPSTPVSVSETPAQPAVVTPTMDVAIPATPAAAVMTVAETIHEAVAPAAIAPIVDAASAAFPVHDERGPDPEDVPDVPPPSPPPPSPPPPEAPVAERPPIPPPIRIAPQRTQQSAPAHPAPRTPNPAPRTSSTPMSSSSSTRARLIAALLVACNAAWLAFTWLTWVPRDVLEVASSPAADIAVHPTLRWRFNLDVVAEADVAKPPLVAPTITPAIAGTWTWHDRRTLEFTPAQDLPEATDFTIALAKDALRTVTGFRLAGPLATEVHTAALAVTGMAVESFAADGSATVVMSFNQAVDPELIASRLRVAPTVDETPAAAAAAAPSLATPPKPVASVRNSGGTTPSTSVRLTTILPAADSFKPAVLTLPPGLPPVAGPRGLGAAWSAAARLGPSLIVTAATAEAPAYGDPTVQLTVSAPEAPRDLLARAITVTPEVAFTATTTPAGISLSGEFVPGQEYRIRTEAAWPSAADATHPLSAYPAAGGVTVTIPPRRAGLWLVDAMITDGFLRCAANGVSQASAEIVALTAGADAPVLAHQDLRWSGADAGPQAIDAELLLAGLPPGTYRLRIRAASGEVPVVDQRIAVRRLAIRPMDLVAGWQAWIETAGILPLDADAYLDVLALQP
jgi:segregation and condensation protein A